MKVIEITVSAGRVVSHPTESYSNLRPQLTLKAMLDEGEDVETATKDLQAKAEKLIEDHKNNLVESIMRLDRMAREDEELKNLEEQLHRSQERLEHLRETRKQLEAAPGYVPPTPIDEDPDHDEPEPVF